MFLAHSSPCRMLNRWSIRSPSVYLSLLVCLAAAFVFASLAVKAADQYFAGDGSSFSAAKWGVSPTGPFTSLFIAGNVANFAVANGTATGASINVAGLNATEDLTITSASGTISI